MLIVDYSWAHPKPDAIRAAGYVGVMRYLTSKVDAKLLQTSERDALHAAGLAIGLIWQTTADEARTGYAGGVERAQRAEAMADALGYPLESPLFFAVDFDATADLVRPYFEGILDTLVRPAGVYGSFRVVEGLPEIPYVWQCAAWSRGQISERAHLYQRIGHTSDERSQLGTTDENRLYRPMPLWLPGGEVMIVNPVKGKITSKYSLKRVNPATGVTSAHLGTDVAAPIGTPIKAPADGKVKAVRTDSYRGDSRPGALPGRTGNGIYVTHAGGVSIYHGHISKALVKAGDSVKAGQVIALVGDTGMVTGPHDHLEVHTVGTVTTDPEPWFRARGVSLGTDPYTVAEVRTVQTLLNLTGAGLTVDGDLGPRTIAAVENFQRSRGLVVDGDPGPITLRALRGEAIPDTPKPEPEDDMPTPAEIAAAVLAAPVPIPESERNPGDAETAPLGDVVLYSNRRAINALAAVERLEAKVDALAAALAAQVTPDVVVEVGDAAAVGEAVAARLAQMTFTAKASL